MKERLRIFYDNLKDIDKNPASHPELQKLYSTLFDIIEKQLKDGNTEGARSIFTAFKDVEGHENQPLIDFLSFCSRKELRKGLKIFLYKN